MSRAWLSYDGKLEDREKARYEIVRQAGLANHRACDENRVTQTYLTRAKWGVYGVGDIPPVVSGAVAGSAPGTAPSRCCPAIFVGHLGASGSVDRPRGVDPGAGWVGGWGRPRRRSDGWPADCNGLQRNPLRLSAKLSSP